MNRKSIILLSVLIFVLFIFLIPFSFIKKPLKEHLSENDFNLILSNDFKISLPKSERNDVENQIRKQLQNENTKSLPITTNSPTLEPISTTELPINMNANKY